MSAEETKPKIEEITEEEVDEVSAGSNVQILNKNEKKARKLIEKLNLKKVEGITRVTFRRGKSHVFVIADPEVFKNPNTGSYVVFGEAKIEDMAAKMAAAQQAAEQAADTQVATEGTKDPAQIHADLESAAANMSLNDGKAEEEDENEVVELGDLSEDDVKMVMEQTNASRNKSIKSLKKNNGDIVNAIMDLTT